MATPASPNSPRAYHENCIDRFHSSKLDGYTVNVAQVIPGILHTLKYAALVSEPFDGGVHRAASTNDYADPQVLYKQRRGLLHRIVKERIPSTAFFDEAVFAAPTLRPDVMQGMARHIQGLIGTHSGVLTIGMRPTWSDPERAAQTAYLLPYHGLKIAGTKDTEFWIGDGAVPVTEPDLAAKLRDSQKSYEAHTVQGNELVAMLGRYTVPR
jgi:hypothetical protein